MRAWNHSMAPCAVPSPGEATCTASADGDQVTSGTATGASSSAAATPHEPANRTRRRLFTKTSLNPKISNDQGSKLAPTPE
ncbi:hypothetical protein GCM10011581_10240 [Saccharopolyspora subtropica]|uniref:Uncharacterized protein n=1 Tax=Saccharopolyspora thermophila TaxID=89367 RepID=A0A917N858_9PSEU|nr:hypothetical protein GCM10011581_10240 [Saccharopolyspora subtropica]